MKQDYPRDLIGYGANPPDAGWPNGARIAVQFVLNYEEGGESSVLHDDAASEVFLSEIIGAAAFDGARHMSMESIYEYGITGGRVAYSRFVSPTSVTADNICRGNGRCP